MPTRPHKETHRDTINYEIDMLEFTLAKLREPPTTWVQDDTNVYLEGFLLHFRNLIRFLNGENEQVDDLSLKTPARWMNGEVNPDEIAAIRTRAIGLEKFFGPISKNLQHCTTLRSDTNQLWDIEVMYREIKPIIDDFERLTPRPTGSTARRVPTEARPPGVTRTQAR
jgi:hypothetical protein